MIKASLEPVRPDLQEQMFAPRDFLGSTIERLAQSQAAKPARRDRLVLPSAEMLTIAWDMDDVLNDLIWAWFHEEWLPSHPDCRLQYRDLLENPPHRILGIESGEFVNMIDAYRESDKAAKLTPSPQILDWLASYGALCLHAVVTARPIGSLPQMSHWLFRHFGGYVRALGVVPVRLKPGEPAYHNTKGEFRSWFGKIDVLVDDSEENLRSAEASGVRGILFPQPWNSNRGTVSDTLRLVTDMVIRPS